MSAIAGRLFRGSVGGVAGLAAVGVVLQVTGCSRYVEDKWSRARPATFLVDGTVEFQGKAVPRATVTFVARDETRGREFSAAGFTDERGRFALQTFRPGDGAIAGSHRVKIEKQSLGGGPPAPSIAPRNREEYEAERAKQAGGKVVNELPARYGSFETSGFTAEVTEKGPNRFVFKLDDSGPPPKSVD